MNQTAMVEQPMADRLSAWRCSGHLKDGRECRRVLMELDYSRTTLVRKTCDKCGSINTLDLDQVRRQKAS
jgi:hypothetical protein